jgi:hypothetical protein
VACGMELEMPAIDREMAFGSWCCRMVTGKPMGNIASIEASEETGSLNKDRESRVITWRSL